MADEQLRALERRFSETGAVEDEAALLAARLRAGLEAPVEVRLRAYLGEPAARQVLGRPPEPPSVSPSRSLAKALERYVAAGGVIEHLLFAPDDLSGRAGHELVARETVRQLDGEETRVREPEATRGARVDLQAFLGARFDLAGRRMLFPGPGGDLLPAAEAQAARAAAQGWGSSDMLGYAYAFSDPPYGLYGLKGLAKVERLFLDVWGGLVGSFEPEEVEVYGWTSDVFSWFGAGWEWWGSFLWTVRPPGDRPWVGIAAATTD